MSENYDNMQIRSEVSFSYTLSSGMPTPPQGDIDHDPMALDVNMKGPDGFTPLMMAAARGTGIDNGNVFDEDGDCGDPSGDTAAIITDLLMQGASINAQTGEKRKSTTTTFLFVCLSVRAVFIITVNTRDVERSELGGSS